MEILSMEGWYLTLRWFHFLSGITWIGILYYFNFIQTPFFATELGGQAKSAMTRGLVPHALWWFRWGAMITFLTGWLIVLTKLFHDKQPLGSGYMTLILTGGLMGTFMWYNVWFIIWPAQRKAIASAEAVASGGEADPEAAKLAPNAGLASRTNTLFSIPMLFFMGSAYHFGALHPVQGGVGGYWLVALVVILAVEANALMGAKGLATQKYITTPSPRGVIHAGFGLALLLYLNASIMLS
jgi:uncharacterized membrane protein